MSERGVHAEVVLNVVAKRLPRILRDALEDRQEQESEENQHAVANGRVAVNRRNHALNNGRARQDVRGEIVNSQPDGHEGHEVEKAGGAVGKDASSHTLGVFFGVGDNSPDLLAQNVRLTVDVFRRHLVACGFCSMRFGHGPRPLTKTLEPSVGTTISRDRSSNL